MKKPQNQVYHIDVTQYLAGFYEVHTEEKISEDKARKLGKLVRSILPNINEDAYEIIFDSGNAARIKIYTGRRGIYYDHQRISQALSNQGWILGGSKLNFFLKLKNVSKTRIN